MAVSFFGGAVEETGVPWNTTDLLEVTDKFSHKMLCRVLYIDRGVNQIHNFSGDEGPWD